MSPPMCLQPTLQLILRFKTYLQTSEYIHLNVAFSQSSVFFLFGCVLSGSYKHVESDD